jgi:16S rRNA (guanine527-N7)-methyltransferase
MLDNLATTTTINTGEDRFAQTSISLRVNGYLIPDSINKKLKVVNEVATAIGLQNLSTQHCRAEDIKNRKFDVVVSRAVAPLKDLWTWSKPLLKKGAKPSGLICLKGGDLANEIFESGCKPRVWEIEKIFDSPFFTDKYLLQVAI